MANLTYADKLKLLLQRMGDTAAAFMARVPANKRKGKLKTEILNILPEVGSFSAASITNSGFTLNWGAVTGATSYTVVTATNSKFTQNFTTQYTGALLTKAVTGLSASTKYYVKLTATASGKTTSTKIIAVTTIA